MKVFRCVLPFVFICALQASDNINLGSFEDQAFLKTERAIYRDVVSYEPYETTCSREVSDATETRCRTVMENHCRKIPGVGDDCTREPVEICEEVSTTRTETYDCIQHRKVVNQVNDHTIYANVEVIKTLRGKNFDLSRCTWFIYLTEGSENFKAFCKTAIIKSKVVERTERTLPGGHKERNIKIDIDFADIKGLEGMSSGLSALVYNKGALSFKSADLKASENVVVDLKIIRNRFLLKDKILFNRSLKTAELNMTSESGEFVTSIDINKLLPAFNPTKKHTLSITLKTLKKVDTTGAINSPQLSNELTQSIVVN